MSNKKNEDIGFDENVLPLITTLPFVNGVTQFGLSTEPVIPPYFIFDDDEDPLIGE